MLEATPAKKRQMRAFPAAQREEDSILKSDPGMTFGMLERKAEHLLKLLLASIVQGVVHAGHAFPGDDPGDGACDGLHRVLEGLLLTAQHHSRIIE